MAIRLFYSLADTNQAIEHLARYAELARREGLLKLEDEIALPRNRRGPGELTNSALHDFFLFLGLRLVVDGTDPELVMHCMEGYREAIREKLHYRWWIWKNFIVQLKAGRKPDEIRANLEGLWMESHPENDRLRAVIEETLEGGFQGGRFDLRRVPLSISDHPLAASCFRLLEARDVDFEAALENHYLSYHDLFFRQIQVVIQGIISLQSGDNPLLMTEALYCTEGREFFDDWSTAFRPRTGADERDLHGEDVQGALPGDDIEALLRRGEGPPRRLPEEVDFGRLWQRLDDRTLQTVLRNIDLYTVARAFSDSAGEDLNRIYRNLSRRAAHMLWEEVETMNADERETRRARDFMLDTMFRLEERGEIALPEDGEA